jgi:hypothetical protein
MRCQEQHRLLEHYYKTIDDLSALIDVLKESGTGSLSEIRLMREKQTAADKARAELERHEQEHGCGR